MTLGSKSRHEGFPQLDPPRIGKWALCLGGLMAPGMAWGFHLDPVTCELPTDSSAGGVGGKASLAQGLLELG